MGSLNDTLLGIIDSLMDDTLINGLDLTTAVTYVSYAPGGYANGSFGSSTTTSTVIRAIRSKFTREEVVDPSQSQTSDTQIKATDIKLIIKAVSGLDFEDYADDYVLLGSSTVKYQIVNVEKSIIGDDDFVYRLQIRKA